MTRCKHLTLVIAIAVSLVAFKARAEDKPSAAAAPKLPAHLTNPLKNPEEDPALPNVLILGDSISIGYTIPVREQLQDKANVFRPRTNCRYSSFGAENLESWLGNRKWDVIHFNWGIWDTGKLHHGKPIRSADEGEYPANELTYRCPEPEYVENLKKIVAMLEATGAKLVWASTTPVLSRGEGRRNDIVRYNRLAAKLMKQRGIPINDLHGYVLPHLDQWQRADGCHYNKLGCQKLGEQVAGSIERALAEKQRSKQTDELLKK